MNKLYCVAANSITSLTMTAALAVMCAGFLAAMFLVAAFPLFAMDMTDDWRWVLAFPFFFIFSMRMFRLAARAMADKFKNL